MNVLDIAENSVAAGATLITIGIDVNTAQRLLTITVADNGGGMSPEMLETVTDPFTTTRTTRRVGLGLPFMKMAAEQTGGSLVIESELNSGTVVKATFTLGHIDLMPIGDMASTITALAQCNPDRDFVFTASADGESFTADTREMRKILGEGVGFDLPQVALWLKDYIAENTNQILKRSTVL